MNKIFRPILYIIILITIYNTAAFSQSCNVDTIYISPSNPNNQTPSYIIAKINLHGYYCNLYSTQGVNFSATLINNNFTFDRIFCGPTNGIPGQCLNTDTVFLGIVPIGSYTITSRIMWENSCNGLSVYQGGCSYPVIQFNVGAFTGINEHHKSLFKISPNPSSGIIQINELDQLLDGIISLIDMEGRIIFQKPWNPLEKVFDFGDLKQGIYFLNINSKEGVSATEKLILIK